MTDEEKLCLAYKESLTQLRLHPTLIWTRNNFFLLTQSGILIFTLSSESVYGTTKRLLPCFAGLFLAFIWIWVNLAGQGLQRHWRTKTQEIEKQLFPTNKEEVIKGIEGPFQSGPEGNKLFASITTALIVLSLGFFVLWLILLILGLMTACGNRSEDGRQSIARSGTPLTTPTPLAAKSWNSSITWDATVVTAHDITNGNFSKLAGPSSNDPNSCCLPPSAPTSWKRALPSAWLANQGHFVQVNNLKVRSDPDHLPDPIINQKDFCYKNGLHYSDAHIPVVSTDDPANVVELTVEFDRCWWSENLCDVAQGLPKADDVIDVQGFVTWDNPEKPIDDPCESCWEIHPVAAWRLSSESPNQGNCGPTTITAAK